MNSLKVHIHKVPETQVPLLLTIAGELGWEVWDGGAGARFPDILVTGSLDPEDHTYLKERIDIHPQVLLWASPRDVEARQLVGFRISGFLDPEGDLSLFREILRKAGEERRWRGEKSFAWHDLEERYAEAAVLLNLALELGPELSIQEVMEKIVQRLAENLGYAIVSIMLLEDDTHLVIKAARGLNQRIVETTRMEVGKGVSGSVALSGEPLLVRDVETDPRFAKGQSHGRYSSKSLICVPLKVGDRVIGVINANNKHRSGPLNEYDLHILSVFASHISVSIERVRLYHNLERKALELKEAYEKLQTIDRMKSDFIINVSHEYRTPVTIIMGYLELLKGSLAGTAEMGKVQTAMEAASRLSSLIDDSTDLLRLDTNSAPFHFQEAPLHYFLEESVRGQWPRFGLKGVDLSLDLPEDLPMVVVDPEKMMKVFDKLLDNALKFTPSGGYTRIRAKLADVDTVQVSVEDSGAGIPGEYRSRIFERFVQGGDIMTEKPEGTGLGLPIALAIVRKHGGRIALDESFEGGCRMLVNLPVKGAAGTGG